MSFDSELRRKETRSVLLTSTSTVFILRKWPVFLHGSDIWHADMEHPSSTGGAETGGGIIAFYGCMWGTR